MRPFRATTATRERDAATDAAHLPAVPVARAVVDCAVYLDGERLPGRHTHDAARETVAGLRADGARAFAWIGLHEPDERQMQSIAADFGLHPLAVEDAVTAHQRPKLERYDDTLFLVLKTVVYVPHESVQQARQIVETGEIMVFVGADFVVTVRHGDHGGLGGVRRALESDAAALARGPYAVMHAVADHVVDQYVAVTRSMECDIDAVEEQAFSPRSRTDIAHIYLLKREVMELRRAIGPLTAALARLADHKDLVGKEILRYLRDVTDHQAAAADQIHTYDELLTSLVQAELAKVGMQQNSDMRKISAWVAIVSVPTMLAGVYGMNFDEMPELHWSYGYPTVLAVMAGVCTLLYGNFRRVKWL